MNNNTRFALTIGAVAALIVGAGLTANALTQTGGNSELVGDVVVLPSSSASSSPSAEVTSPATSPTDTGTADAVEVTPSPSVIDLRGDGSIDDNGSDDDDSDDDGDDHGGDRDDDSDDDSDDDNSGKGSGDDD